jgi:hypothetical protein
MKIIALAFTLILLPVNSYAIRLIIDGRTYYVDNYQISDNGQTIIVKENKILNKTLSQRHCAKNKNSRKVAGRSKKNSASNTKAIRKRSNPFGSLMKSLDGGFQRMHNDFKVAPKKKPYVQDFR